MYDAYNANREQWQCACTIALPRCSLSSTKIHKNPELLASRDKEMKLPIQHRQSIEYQRSVNLIGTWLFFESFLKVSESVNA